MRPKNEAFRSRDEQVCVSINAAALAETTRKKVL